MTKWEPEMKAHLCNGEGEFMELRKAIMEVPIELVTVQTGEESFAAIEMLRGEKREGMLWFCRPARVKVVPASVAKQPPPLPDADPRPLPQGRSEGRPVGALGPSSCAHVPLLLVSVAHVAVACVSGSATSNTSRPAVLPPQVSPRASTVQCCAGFGRAVPTRCLIPSGVVVCC